MVAAESARRHSDLHEHGAVCICFPDAHPPTSARTFFNEKNKESWSVRWSATSTQLQPTAVTDGGWRVTDGGWRQKAANLRAPFFTKRKERKNLVHQKTT